MRCLTLSQPIASLAVRNAVKLLLADQSGPCPGEVVGIHAEFRGLTARARLACASGPLCQALDYCRLSPDRLPWGCLVGAVTVLAVLPPGAVRLESEPCVLLPSGEKPLVVSQLESALFRWTDRARKWVWMLTAGQAYPYPHHGTLGDGLGLWQLPGLGSS